MNPKIPRTTFDETVKMQPATDADFEEPVDRIMNDLSGDSDSIYKEPTDETEAFQKHDDEKASSGTDQNAIPDWVALPPNFNPPSITGICFMRLRADWTPKPALGDRTIILWPLSLSEEHNAFLKVPPDAKPFIINTYLALSCIRYIDGKRAVWGGISDRTSQYNVLRFADEIGSKCLNLIRVYYHQAHNFNDEQFNDFLANCYAFRSGMNVVTTTNHNSMK